MWRFSGRPTPLPFPTYPVPYNFSYCRNGFLPQVQSTEGELAGIRARPHSRRSFIHFRDLLRFLAAPRIRASAENPVNSQRVSDHTVSFFEPPKILSMADLQSLPKMLETSERMPVYVTGAEATAPPGSERAARAGSRDAARARADCSRLRGNPLIRFEAGAQLHEELPEEQVELRPG